MVMPMGGGGMGEGPDPMGPLPPPEELNKFKPLMVVIVLGYFAVAAMMIIAVQIASAIMYLLLAALLLMMVLRPNQYLGTCVLPLTMLAGLILFIDVLQLLTTMASNRYGVGNGFLQTNCTATINLPLGDFQGARDPMRGSFVNATTKQVVNIILPLTTHVDWTRNACSWRTYLWNLASILAVLFDFMATSLGCRMWKLATSMLSEMPGMLGGQNGGNQGAQGQGGAGGGQVGGQGPPPQQTFNPFQGTGRNLSG